MAPVTVFGMALLLPAAVAAVVVLAARGLSGRAWLPVAGVVAVGLAYVAAQFAIARPAFPPLEVTDRLPWLALAATVWGVVEAFWPMPRPARAAGRAGLLALTLGLLLGPVVGAGEIEREMLTRLALLVLVAAAAWGNIDVLSGRSDEEAPELARALWLTSAGSGVALMASGSAVLGQLGLALAAAQAGAWLSSAGRARGVGVVPLVSALLTGLVVEGFVYASLPAISTVLLAAAPAAAWSSRLGPLRRLAPLAASACVGVLVLIAVGTAVGLAVAASPSFDY